MLLRDSKVGSLCCARPKNTAVTSTKYSVGGSSVGQGWSTKNNYERAEKYRQGKEGSVVTRQKIEWGRLINAVVIVARGVGTNEINDGRR